MRALKRKPVPVYDPTTTIERAALPVDIKRLLSKPALPSSPGPVYSIPDVVSLPPISPTSSTHRTRNILKRRPSANNTRSSPQNLTSSHSPPPHSPDPAVAQEANGLEDPEIQPTEIKDDISLPPPTPPPKDRPAFATLQTSHLATLETTTGMVVAVGDPEDHTGAVEFGFRNLFTHRHTEKTSPRTRLNKAPAGPRALSRKISGKWRKVTNRAPVEPSPMATGSVPARNHDHKNSPQRRKSLTLLLVDDHADPPVDTNNGTQSLPTTITTNSRPSLPEPQPRTSEKPVSLPRRANSELVSGRKIWKLMKQISAGGLRDKYHYLEPTEQPPPLPPPPLPPPPLIPKKSGSDLAGALLRLMPSGSPSRKPSVLLKPNKAGGTRSSSPGSSDVASSRFRYPTHSHSSTRSSSSYGDELPHAVSNTATPTVVVGQHIIPPDQLYHLNPDPDQEQEHKPDIISDHRHSQRAHLQDSNGNGNDDYWVLDSPKDEHLPSLPLPPPRTRRSGGDGAAKTDASTEEEPPLSVSPTIPSFSNVGAINTFGSRRSRLTEIGIEMDDDQEVNPSDVDAPAIPSSAFGEASTAEEPLASPTPSQPSPPPIRPPRSAKRAFAAAAISIAVAAGSRPKSAPSHQRHFTISSTPTLAIPPSSSSAGAGADDFESGRPTRRSMTRTRMGTRTSISEVRSSIASTLRPSLRPRSSSLSSISALRKLRRGPPEPLPLPLPFSPSPSLPLPFPSGTSTTSTSTSTTNRLPSSGGLTQQEKAEKWDDLLARCDQAGGTLHIRSSMLISDLVSLSSASELTLDPDAYT